MTTTRQSGFTLIEVMVGVVIALISMIAMFQVQENFEQQRRSIVSGGDAQVSGSISAFHIERDLRNAGSGFGNSAYLGCTVSAHDEAGPRDFTFTYAPVVIADGVGGAPDSISILAGNSSSPTATFEVAAATATVTSLKDTRMGLSLGDLAVLATPGAPATCWLTEITNRQPVLPDSGREIGHATTGYTRTTQPPTNRMNSAGGWGCTDAFLCTPRFNPVPAVAAINFSATGNPIAYGELRSLGDDPRLNTWSVDWQRAMLMRNDLIHDGTTNTDVGDGIVDLQAQYGLDTDGDDIVDTWQAATPNWTQVRVVRFALLARGESYDRVAVTTAAPTWSGGAFVMHDLDSLTADAGPANLGVNNWRNYRYSVFENTVSLRNMIWRRFW